MLFRETVNKARLNLAHTHTYTHTNTVRRDYFQRLEKCEQYPQIIFFQSGVHHIGKMENVPQLMSCLEVRNTKILINVWNHVER